jgi:hypothetical protein
MVRPGRTGGLLPYQWWPKLSSLDYSVGFLQGERIIAIKVLMAFNQHISAKKVIPLIVSIYSFHL